MQQEQSENESQWSCSYVRTGTEENITLPLRPKSTSSCGVSADLSRKSHLKFSSSEDIAAEKPKHCSYQTLYRPLFRKTKPAEHKTAL